MMPISTLPLGFLMIQRAAAVFLIFSGVAASDEPKKPISTDFYEASRRAVAEGRPLLVLTVADSWCSHCPAARKSLESVNTRTAIPVIVDYDTASPALRLHTVGKVVRVPTFSWIVYNGYGSTAWRITGAYSPEQLQTWIDTPRPGEIEVPVVVVVRRNPLLAIWKVLTGR